MKLGGWYSHDYDNTYDVIGSMYREMGGGSGLKYAASTIVYLSRKSQGRNECNRKYHSCKLYKVS